MTEKEKDREGSGGGSQGDTVEGRVTWSATPLGRFVLKKGTTLGQLLDEIQAKHGKQVDLSRLRIRLNDRTIRVVNGKLEEDPVLENNFNLAVVTQMQGGN